MDVGEIIFYGIYNSKKIHSTLTISPSRKVECFEFDYVTSCSKNAVSCINDKKQKLFQNMIVLRKPGETSFSYLHFNCYCLHIAIEKDNPIYDQLLALPTYFTIINEKTYQPLFEALLKHLVKDEKNKSDYFTTAKILELIYHLIKNSKQNRNAYASSLHKENVSIQKTVNFMKKNLSQKISLQTLSEIANYSPNHFREIFTNIMGISPQKHLEELRLKHAKFLLTQNELSLSDVAYLCGFCSQAYFSKLFKKHFSINPKEYREQTLRRWL
jgi:AraC-like DNA-binding protein